MRVLVTGGAGLIGGAIARRLVSQGFSVHTVDMLPEFEIEGATYAQCNILDFDAVQKNVKGCDAVVHMAAIRSPLQAQGQDVFEVNVSGTFKVFEAAAKEGINRVVQASSINAMGCSWNTGDVYPQYFPLDEEHPILTYDPYSFSKESIENIGAYFWRREGISGTAFRYPAVYQAERYLKPESFERRKEMVHLVDELAALPEAELKERMTDAHERTMDLRSRRVLEMLPDGTVSPELRLGELMMYAYFFDRFNFWDYIDVRDAAIAVENALTADYEGSHPLFVNDRLNALNYDSETLLRLFFPDVNARKSPLPGATTIVSIDKAHDLIGFEPQYSLVQMEPSEIGEIND